MSDINLNGINPIPLTAVVTLNSTGYQVAIEYDLPPPTTVGDIYDSFTAMPATITVLVSSTTVPTNYHLQAGGDGTWTTLSDSSITGTFTTDEVNRFHFTILVTDGTVTLAKIDPRLIIRKLGSV